MIRAEAGVAAEAPMQSGRWLCYRLRVERVSVGRPRLWRLAKYSDFGHGHSMRCPDQPVVEVKVATFAVPLRSEHGPCRHDLRDSVDSR